MGWLSEESQGAMVTPISSLDAALKKLEQIDLPPKHEFAQGMYLRTLFMPAGTVATGKIHKTQHVFILTKGTLAIATNDSAAIEVSAPFMCISEPGTQRAAYAITDCVLSNVHITDETNIEKIENETVEQMALPHAQQQIEG